MRSRQIRKDFPQKTSILSREARLLQALLPLVADDEGRLSADVAELVAHLYPCDADAMMMLPTWLDELESRRCVERYRGGRKDYLYVTDWCRNQQISHPTASELPAPPSFDRKDSGKFRKVPENRMKRRPDGASGDFPENEDVSDAQEPAETQEQILREIRRLGRRAADRGAYSPALRSIQLRAQLAGLLGKTDTAPPAEPRSPSPAEIYGLPATVKTGR